MSDEHAGPTVGRRVRSITVSDAESDSSEPTAVSGRGAIERRSRQPATQFDSQSALPRSHAFGGLLGVDVLRRRSPARLLYRTFGETPVGDPAVDARPAAPPGAEVGDAGRGTARHHVVATDASTVPQRSPDQHSDPETSYRPATSNASTANWTQAASTGHGHDPTTAQRKPTATGAAVGGETTQSAIDQSTKQLTARRSNPITAYQRHRSSDIQHRQSGGDTQSADTVPQQSPLPSVTASDHAPRPTDRRAQQTVDQPDRVGDGRTEARATTAGGNEDVTHSTQSLAMTGVSSTKGVARLRPSSSPARTDHGRQSTTDWAVWPARRAAAGSHVQSRHPSQTRTGSAAAVRSDVDNVDSGPDGVDRRSRSERQANPRQQPAGRPSLVVATEQKTVPTADDGRRTKPVESTGSTGSTEPTEPTEQRRNRTGSVHRSAATSDLGQSSTAAIAPAARRSSGSGQSFDQGTSPVASVSRPTATQRNRGGRSTSRLARLQQVSRSRQLSDTRSAAASGRKRTKAVASSGWPRRQERATARREPTAASGSYNRRSTDSDRQYARQPTGPTDESATRSTARPAPSQPGTSNRSERQFASEKPTVDGRSRRASVVSHVSRPASPAAGRRDRRNRTASTATPWPHGTISDRTRRRTETRGNITSERTRAVTASRPVDAVSRTPSPQDSRQSSRESVDRLSVDAVAGRSVASWPVAPAANRQPRLSPISAAQSGGETTQKGSAGSATVSSTNHRPVWPSSSSSPATPGSQRDTDVGDEPSSQPSTDYPLARLAGASRQPGTTPQSLMASSVDATNGTPTRQITAAASAQRGRGGETDHRSTRSAHSNGQQSTDSRSRRQLSTASRPTVPAGHQPPAAAGQRPTLGGESTPDAESTTDQRTGRTLPEPQQPSSQSGTQRAGRSTTPSRATSSQEHRFGDRTDVDAGQVASMPATGSDQSRTPTESVAAWNPRSRSRSTVTRTSGVPAETDDPTSQATVDGSRPTSSTSRSAGVLQVAASGGSAAATSTSRSSATETAADDIDRSAATSFQQSPTAQSTAVRNQRPRSTTPRDEPSAVTAHRRPRLDTPTAAETAGIGSQSGEAGGRTDGRDAQPTALSTAQARGRKQPSTDHTEHRGGSPTVSTTVATTRQRQPSIARLPQNESTLEGVGATTATPSTHSNEVESAPSQQEAESGVQHSDNVAIPSVAEFGRSRPAAGEFEPQLRAAVLGSTATERGRSAQHGAAGNETHRHRTAAAAPSTSGRSLSGRSETPAGDTASEASTGNRQTQTGGRPRLTLETRRESPPTATDSANEERMQQPRSAAGQTRSTTASHTGDGRPSQSTGDPFGSPSTDDPFGGVERADSRPDGPAGAAGAAGAFGQQAGRRRRDGRPRDEASTTQQRDGSPVGSLSYDADVDRLVETLYRRLERKLRIERERKGL